MADFAPRDNEERALLCLIAPHVIKLHSSAQPGEGGGSVTLQSSIVKTGQSDGACCCRLSLVTWAWCLLHEERATLMPATVSRGGRWYARMRGGIANLTLTCLKSQPEMKKPPVTALKIVSDGGRISALPSLPSTKQDDCYCGTLLQRRLQTSHFGLKRKCLHCLKLKKHVHHPHRIRFEVLCINGTWFLNRASS